MMNCQYDMYKLEFTSLGVECLSRLSVFQYICLSVNHVDRGNVIEILFSRTIRWLYH